MDFKTKAHEWQYDSLNGVLESIKQFNLSWPTDPLTATHPIQHLNKPRPQLYAYFHCVVNTHTMNQCVCEAN